MPAEVGAHSFRWCCKICIDRFRRCSRKHKKIYCTMRTAELQGAKFTLTQAAQRCASLFAGFDQHCLGIIPTWLAPVKLWTAHRRERPFFCLYQLMTSIALVCFPPTWQTWSSLNRAEKPLLSNMLVDTSSSVEVIPSTHATSVPNLIASSAVLATRMSISCTAYSSMLTFRMSTSRLVKRYSALSVHVRLPKGTHTVPPL